MIITTNLYFNGNLTFLIKINLPRDIFLSNVTILIENNTLVEKMRLKQYDDLIIAIMCLTAIGSLYMLYGARFFSQNKSNEIKIASIVEQIKTVKRKKDFYQSWVDVNPGDSLSPNDEIYTHEQSSAKINFVNGPQISLYENSLLRIKTISKDNSLTLDRGNLTAKLTEKSPKLDLMMNGKKYSFESKNANIQIEQGSTENRFMLLDGKAKLNIGEKSENLESNQILVQNKKTGDLKIKQLTFIPKLPLNNFTSYFNQQKLINFTWNYTQQAVPLKIVISKTSTFSEIFATEEIDQNLYTAKFDSPGTYYWKLITQDNIEGPIRSFTLKKEVTPIIDASKNVVYIGPKKLDKVALSWSASDAKIYLLKIESPNKNNLNLNLAKNYYELKNLEVGKYQIAVKVNEKLRPDALWSENISLDVLEEKEIIIKNTSAEFVEKVSYNKSPLSHFLSWDGPTSDINYTVTLSKNNISKKYETENTNYNLNLLEPGEYLWEVTGLTPSGISTNTIKGKIILKMPLKISQTPAEGAVIELEKPDQLVSFKWDKVSENSNYQFELSSDSNFQKIIYDKSLETNIISTALAKTGRYFWRVKIKNGDSYDYSNPVSVEIKPTPPLEIPDINPSIKIKIKYLDKKSSMHNIFNFFINSAEADEPATIAEWDLPVNSRAKTYIVEIYKDKTLSQLITRIESNIPHITWKNPTAGEFYWRVSYEDFWGRRTEFSKISALKTELDQEIIKAEQIKKEELFAAIPIELISPKNKENILNEEENIATFSWNPIEKVKIYQLTIAKDSDFQMPLVKTKTNTTKLEINCKNFENSPGEYYWKITSELKNTSKIRNFKILCTPKKEEPPSPPPPPEVVATVEKPNPHFFRIGFFPHHLTYDNKSLYYTAKVSGNALNSWYGMYQTPIEWKWFKSLESSLWISRGKVFNTITFTDLDIIFKAHKIENSFSWGPIFSIMKKTLYVESSRSITSASQTTPLAGVFIQKDFEKITINANGQYGGAFILHADFLVSIKNKISAGAFFDSTSLTKDGAKHSFSRMGLNLNYTFDLLEKTK